MPFEFATATRLIFGSGGLAQAGGLVSSIGTRALIVTGRKPGRAEPLQKLLTQAGVRSEVCSIEGEPTVDRVARAVKQARDFEPQCVIGMGGGSPVDAGKAIAALLANEGELLDYLEVIGSGQPLIHAPLPYLAIPTTAGTGAEVTRNAVLASPRHQVKVSLRSPLMLPRVALVDPELTLGLPPSVTATTGLDALTQLIESFVSCRANPLTDALCREGIRCAVRSLRRAFRNGSDLQAREDMSLAGMLSGMALANSGLGAVHGFAAPIGGRFPAPHGAVCAALVAPVVEANRNALGQRQPESPVRARFGELAVMLTGDPEAAPEAAVAWLEQLVHDLEIPGLAAYGITESHIPELVSHASRASSMKGNPLPLEASELEHILSQAL